ncbi:MAG: NAD(P)/FAD-dependent oxidoreductase [Clostridia bacterium]|nr:NAD(P)/FAD-dependent oxidoreductase [Clostridia bacterium]
MFDCIIVGSGLAAISAALTLKANAKSFLMIGEKNLSDKISKAEEIHNYPAFLGVSGTAFAELLKTQLENEEIVVTQGRVNGVYAMKEKFAVTTQDGGMYESKTVILACGVESGKRIKGEQEFLGRGVSYCATCDGALYKNKKIAVVCLAKKFEHEAKYLSEIAEKTYLFPLYKGLDLSGEKIEKIIKMPSEIVGEKRVKGVLYEEKGEAKHLNVDGVFILKEGLPPDSIAFGVETDGVSVKTDRRMQTNLKGCFACGDITGRPYQYAKAVGEGNVAAHSVVEYLNEK